MNLHPGPDDEAAFQALLDYIRQERGLDCRQYKPNYLRRRLAVRMRALRVQSYAEYMAYLVTCEAEYERLFTALTINLSYFFRDASLYQALREEVLPALLKARHQTCRLRIWSAGCAGGEEPYSLAILLQELLSHQQTTWQLHIYATDIDGAVLERARRGRFSHFSLQNVDEHYTSRYFTLDGNEYILIPTIRNMVEFQQADLNQMTVGPVSDLILCRNVLIYFTKAQQERLFHLFHRTLPDDGVLVIGKTEILPLNLLHLFQPLNRREHIYAKTQEPIPQPPLRGLAGKK